MMDVDVTGALCNVALADGYDERMVAFEELTVMDPETVFDTLLEFTTELCSRVTGAGPAEIAAALAIAAYRADIPSDDAVSICAWCLDGAEPPNIIEGSTLASLALFAEVMIRVVAQLTGQSPLDVCMEIASSH